MKITSMAGEAEARSSRHGNTTQGKGGGRGPAEKATTTQSPLTFERGRGRRWMREARLPRPLALALRSGGGFVRNATHRIGVNESERATRRLLFVAGSVRSAPAVTESPRLLSLSLPLSGLFKMPNVYLFSCHPFLPSLLASVCFVCLGWAAG